MDGGLMYLLLSVAAIAAALAMTLHVRRTRGRAPWTPLAVVAVVLAAGYSATERSARAVADRVEDMLSGYAPTYARELEALGHHLLASSGADLDPGYLRIIEAQKRWAHTNSQIADIYTMRMLDDGRVVLVVDSETDYNGDGEFSDETEGRTLMGEEYSDVTEGMLAAFAGSSGFDHEPYTDRWGAWISAFAPIHAPDGSVEAIVGVDFSAQRLNEQVQSARLRTMSYIAAAIMVLGAGSMLLGLRKEALDRARRAEATKDAFLASISHEIRTPMTAILGFADLLSDPGTPEAEREESVRCIRRSGNHLLALLNDVLDISKIEAGQMTLERVPCRPGEILSDVQAMFAALADRKGVPVSLEVAPDVPAWVTADPTRLRQIVANLVGNALKFTNRGSVTVSARREGDSTLVMTVTDTGIGMTPAQMTGLFQPFAQADRSTARRFGGTGLGLSISRRLAGLMGGTVTVASTPGRGSVFTVKVIAPMCAEPGPPVPALRSVAEGQRLAGIRVLIADDTADIRRLVSMVLRRAGAEVEMVDDGEPAVVRALNAHEARIDVVLMDMQMPQTDGYEAARRLRAGGFAGAVIAMTANTSGQDRSRCLDAGCDRFLCKPIDRDALIEACVKSKADRVAPAAA